jgi:hypothetical protein
MHTSPRQAIVFTSCRPCTQVTRGDMVPRALWRWAALQVAEKAAASGEPARRGPSAGTLEVRPAAAFGCCWRSRLCSGPACH